MTRRSLVFWLSIVCGSPFALGAPGAEPGAALSTAQRRLVEEVLAAQHPYDCCTDTIAACLKQEPVCPLARRLERAVRRMAGAGMTRARIEHALELRRRSMTMAGPPAAIEQDDRFRAGDPRAPIVLAVYACGRSALCAKLIPRLYGEVSSERFMGKVRLYYRPFFPDAREESAACGRALVAAADQGRFWPFLLYLYYHEDNFKLCLLRRWADFAGLDRDAFESALDHQKTTEALAAAKREGTLNQVDAVPCAFINGRKIQGELSVEALLDLLEEESERDSWRR